ncbi:MAG: anthranilate synthase component I family protein [Bacteroidota bacterium]
MRQFISYSTLDIDLNKFKNNLLTWSDNFNRICYLNSNFSDNNHGSQGTGNNNDFSLNPQSLQSLNPQGFENPEGFQEIYNNYDCIAAVGSVSEITVISGNAFSAIKKFFDIKQDWLFGFFTYDLKNEVEELKSENFDGIKMPLLHFFQPEYVFIINKDNIQIGFLEELTTKDEIHKLFEQINDFGSAKHRDAMHRVYTSDIQIKSSITREQYLNSVHKLKEHIRYGDIYEVNFCQEFYAENAEIDPLHVYMKLNDISLAPFSCYYRLGDKHLMSASPERFMKKTGRKIISQPIKGTIHRGATKEEDDVLRQLLLNDPKERGENVMIVDLVRNDLSKTAKKGSVRVEELFGIYTFRQVHQMISTVASELREEAHFIEAIKSAFPMGSMTGAPKVRAMELIEEHESTKRGLYSGAVGYITPEGDFDLNVVIRSILYNQAEKYLSFMVGGAITDKSIPEKEYEECLLKAKAMFEVFNNDFTD